MVAWTSLEQIASNEVSFIKIAHVFSGFFFWEFLISLDFEWSFLTGQKRFSWPMIPYFVGRYSALFMVVCLLVSVDIGRPIDCQALYTAICVGILFSFGMASINLAIRAMVVWSMKWYCVVPLCILIAIHWGLGGAAVVVKATWSPEGAACLALETRHDLFAGSIVFSTCMDFVVLALCAWKLLPRRTNSQLMDLLYSDGLVYFLAAFVLSIPLTVLMIMNLNPVMDVIFVVPAATISTTVASRAVRRLSNFSVSTPAIHMTVSTSNQSNSTKAARPGAGRRGERSDTWSPKRVSVSGIQVEMDTFTSSADEETGRPVHSMRAPGLEDPEKGKPIDLTGDPFP